mgnify:CR=1 FL=1
MSDNNQAGTACDLRGIREAVCVHTDKISDSCLAKDCIEDLQVYLTVPSQQALDCAVSAKARYVELLHVGVHVETVPYSTGYYTVDLTFYYRVIADASAAGGRPTTVTGLAIFSKRLVMFGGETSARSFSSRSGVSCLCKQAIQAGNVPEAIVEVVDPMILGSRPRSSRRPSSAASRSSSSSTARASVCSSQSDSSPSRGLSAARSCSSRRSITASRQRRAKTSAAPTPNRPARSSARSSSRWTPSSPARTIPASPPRTAAQTARRPPRKQKSPPLRRGGGRSPKAIRGGRSFFILPRASLCSASPLLVEGAFYFCLSALKKSPAPRAHRTSARRARPTSFCVPLRCGVPCAPAACHKARPRTPPQNPPRRPRCG